MRQLHREREREGTKTGQQTMYENTFSAKFIEPEVGRRRRQFGRGFAPVKCGNNAPVKCGNNASVKCAAKCASCLQAWLPFRLLKVCAKALPIIFANCSFSLSLYKFFLNSKKEKNNRKIASRRIFDFFLPVFPFFCFFRFLSLPSFKLYYLFICQRLGYGMDIFAGELSRLSL